MDERVVLITGCSSGIGRALCLAFHRRGLRVVATARRRESLDGLPSAGIRADRLDVLDARQIQDVVQRIRTMEGRLDILVNNAGYGLFGPLLDLPPDDLGRQFATNLFAPLQLVREGFPLLRDTGGIVVNIGSISGVFTTPFAGAYCASKSALHVFSEVLRVELRPFGIRVVEVQPGAVRSRFGETGQQQADKLLKASSPFASLRPAVLERAGTSQVDATAAEMFADRCVHAILKAHPRPIVRLGRLSRRLPLLKTIMPARALDRLLARKYGLNIQFPRHPLV